jgi:hypothetical protein
MAVGIQTVLEFYFKLGTRTCHYGSSWDSINASCDSIHGSWQSNNAGVLPHNYGPINRSLDL